MRITNIDIGHLSAPLKKPFKTAVRTVEALNDVIIRIGTDTEHEGYGEAPPTGVITGDTTGAIIGAIEDHIRPALLGCDIEDMESAMDTLDRSIIGNFSAKAAVDAALYDLWGKRWGIPVYRLLGGYRSSIDTDITISVNEPDEMARDSAEAVKNGYGILKIKVGKDPAKDFDRIKAIRKEIGYDVKLRIDANQGWSSHEAVRILKRMEDAGFGIELVEQPVPAHDVDGLKYVTDNTDIPVAADESIWSPRDALKLLQCRAADIINIKLMKCGGLHNAVKIATLAEIYGVECMVGCMMEGQISVTAAVALASAKSVVTRIDLDTPFLCSEMPVNGGADFEGPSIYPSDKPGFGFEKLDGSFFE